MSKVTMQDIADALNISRVTVWKVFNNHTGVSAALQERILEKAKELGYLRVNTEHLFTETERNVSLIVSRPDSSTFWTNIIHRMAQEFSYHKVNLIYTYLPAADSEGFAMPAILTGGTIEGAIVLNVYDIGLIRKINRLELPKVYLDTVPQMERRELRGDLVLLEGHDTLYEITESILNRGVTDLGFIGDIQYARTNMERYRGFCDCMHDHKLPVNEEASLTGSIGIFSYHREICEFLDSLEKLPQAFICASDYIAHFLQSYFSEHKERIPEGIIVTGYDGSREYSNVEGLLTTADVKTRLLGKRLSMQMLYRMEHPEAPFELAYVNPPIIYRESVFR